MTNQLIQNIQSLMNNSNFGDQINTIKANPNVISNPNDLQFISDIMKPVVSSNLQQAQQQIVQSNLNIIKSKENFSNQKLINKNEFRYAMLATIIYFIFSQPQISNYIQKYIKKNNLVKPIILLLVFVTYFMTSKYLI